MTVQQCTIVPLDSLSEEDQKALEKKLKEHSWKKLSDFNWMMTLKPYDFELLKAVQTPSREASVTQLIVVDSVEGVVLVAIAKSLNPSDLAAAQERLRQIVLEEAAAAT